MNIKELLTRKGDTEVLKRLRQNITPVVVTEKTGWDLSAGEKMFCQMTRQMTNYTQQVYDFLRGSWRITSGDAVYTVTRDIPGGKAKQVLLLKIKRFSLCYELGNYDKVFFTTKSAGEAIRYLITWKSEFED